MKSLLKQSMRSRLLLVLVFVLAGLAVQLQLPGKAAADYKPDVHDNETICQLPQTSDRQPAAQDGGPYYITTSFIDQYHIKVTFNNPTQFTCSNKNIQRAINIIYGNYDITKYIDGTYTQTLDKDGNIIYKGGADSSIIRLFRNPPSNADASDNAIKRYFDTAEFKIRVDESKVGNLCAEKYSWDDDDVYYDTAKKAWWCWGKGDYSPSGLIIKNTIDPTTIKNYNITFKYDGQSIKSLTDGDTTNFQLCSGQPAGQLAWGTDNCTGGEFLNVAEKDPNTIGTGSYAYSVYGSASDAIAKKNSIGKIVVAGAGAPAQIPGSSGDDGGGGGTDSGAQCEDSVGLLGWIICPIIEGVANAADGIYGSLIQPLLAIPPVSLDTNTANFKVWSNFRIIGDVILIIALLIIVFGQSLGGGLIDAYTAKKILPRLLASAILINISYYIVALAVDVSNVVGFGVINLIIAPFNAAGASIHVGVGADLLADGLGIWAAVEAILAIGSGASLAGAVAAKALIFEFVKKMSGYFLLFIVLPTFLTLLAIVAVLLFREGLILLLLLLSPLAFALYCLPNTEQYFRKWWDALFKALLVYPIVASLFAISKVLAYTITNPATGADRFGVVKPILALIALVTPLFLIPFSFKIAGGFLGRLHEIAAGGGKRLVEGIKGNANDPNSLRNQAKFKALDGLTAAQERSVRRLQQPGTSRRGRMLGKALNAGNLQARRSRYNKQGAGIMADQIATGDDTNVRDTLIAWDASANGGKGAWFRRMDMERGADGKYHGVPGASAVYSGDKDGNGAYQQGKDAHDKALSLWGGNQSYMQEAMYYEWKKTGFDSTKIGRLQDQYGEIVKENNFTGAEAGGLMKGVVFKHQGQSLSSKHESFKEVKGPDGKGTGQWGWERDGIAYANEWGRMIDTYGAGKQDEKSYQDMTEDYVDMSAVLTDQNTRSMRDEDVFQKGRFKGKTKAQVTEARDIIERASIAADPDQRQAGTRPIPVMKDGGDEQVGAQAGGFGISSAPVKTQEAARKLREATKAQMDAERRPAPSPSGYVEPPRPQRQQPPQTPPQSQQPPQPPADNGDWRNPNSYL